MLYPLPHLAAERARRMLSQHELAELSGVAQATISHIERGRPASGRTLRRLARSLGVDPAALGAPREPEGVGA